MKPATPYLKGRGSQINPANRFHKMVYDENPIDWEQWDAEEEPSLKTQIIEVHPKTILNKVESPDIPSGFSMNPYQGCEHGCIYCYARVSHQYWGYSAGVDFEQKILVKKNAPALLDADLRSPKWQATSIMLAGNTDCYQPIERQLRITRDLLEVFWKYRHPVGIITKNSLVLRDLDILTKMAEHNLVSVAVSVTTLNDDLRKIMEPRTASISSRLKTIKALSGKGIPAFAMLAPMIPGLNDHEIFDLAKAVSDAGARGIGYTIVRLNGEIADIFTDWIQKNYPDRAEKVLNKIKDAHGGSLGDSRFRTRMRGEGNIAEIIKQQFQLAKKKFFADRQMPALDYTLHEKFKPGQLKLF